MDQSLYRLRSTVRGFKAGSIWNLEKMDLISLRQTLSHPDYTPCSFSSNGLNDPLGSLLSYLEGGTLSSPFDCGGAFQPKMPWLSSGPGWVQSSYKPDILGEKSGHLTCLGH